MSGGSRTAFELWPALEHKGKQSVISAIAVDDTAQHIYLGTSDGQLEEHRIHSSYQSVRVSLGARKHIGKKVCAHSSIHGLVDGLAGPSSRGSCCAKWLCMVHAYEQGSCPCSL